MTEEDYKLAAKHCEDFYNRTNDILQMMIDAAQQADSNIGTILGVPPPAKTFTDGLISSLFTYALKVAFPGWTLMAKVFEGEKGERARAIADIYFTGKELLGGEDTNDSGHANSNLKGAQARIAAITNMIAGLEGAKSVAQGKREAAEAKLIEKRFHDKAKYTLAQAKTEIGDLPPLLDPDTFSHQVYCFEYQLWQRFVQDYVTLKLWVNFDRQITRWDTTGINKNAVVYITNTFGQFVATGGVKIEKHPGSFDLRLNGLPGIRTYEDLATVWFADVTIEGCDGWSSGGKKISPALEEEIKMTSVKLNGAPRGPQPDGVGWGFVDSRAKAR